MCIFKWCVLNEQGRSVERDNPAEVEHVFGQRDRLPSVVDGASALAQIRFTPVVPYGSPVAALLRPQVGHALVQHPRMDHHITAHSKVYLLLIQHCMPSLTHISEFNEYIKK